MTLTEARKVLGLGPDEDPRIHLADLKEARESIAELVRTAPNDTLGDRYQKGLIEFDQALAAVREHFEAIGQAAPPLPPMQVAPAEDAPPSPTLREEISAPVVPKNPAAPRCDEPPTLRRNRTLSVVAWLVILLVAVSAGGWIYLQNERNNKEQRLTRVAFLEHQGSILIENRRWPEATKAFEEIENLSPGSEISLIGRSRIEAGMGEEQTQFIGYWTGQALAELEAGRLDEATAAARRVLEKYPNHPEATALLSRIATARVSQSRTAAITAARAQLDQRKWNDAVQTAKSLLATLPDDPDAKAIVTDATAALEKAAADQLKAADLLQKAPARDQGQFDQQSLDWLRDAKLLDPDNAQIAAQLEKLSSYTRTLRVPEDFATPEEALAQARDRDRIVLGAQTWKGPLIVNAAVDLQSEDPMKTIVQCTPENGSAITIGPGAKGARITGITFRHESFAIGIDRFAAALVRGGSAVFTNCRFTDASGHGLAVIEKGQATADHCRFEKNGWNGAAAIGEGCTLEVKDSESIGNFEHGIESWNGAAVILTNNRCEGNSRNGIHADNGAAPATITGNQLIANREFGLVLDSAGSGKISGNTARTNLLGGLVIRAAAAKLPVTGNQAQQNQGPGLILEKGLSPASYIGNTASQNANPQVLSNANLSQQEDIAPAKGPNAPQEEVPPTAIIVEPAPEP